MLKLISGIIALFICLNSFSQFGFNIVGNTYGVTNINDVVCGEVDSCFTLTDDDYNQKGAVWDNKQINLNFSFDATFCMTLGTKNDDGADGFAFILRTESSDSLGIVGGGLGFEGIVPSLAIEFDTWENADKNDPFYDHTCLVYNSDFFNPLVAPIALSPNTDNVEDGLYHQARIVWDVATQTLQMYFDGIMRFSYTGDIVNNFFGGDNTLTWGFTASTGGFSNLQQICFPKHKIKLDDLIICDGEMGLISFYADGLTSYKWTRDDGTIIKNWSSLDNVPFDLADTSFFTDIPGEYILEIGINNQVVIDTIELIKIDLPLKPFTQEEVTLCLEDSTFTMNALNPGYLYLWSTGDSTQTITVQDGGNYFVEIIDSVYLCKNYDTILVKSLCQAQVDFPNIFTPNSDTINQNYQLIFDGDFKWLSDFEFSVFNRWGEQVYFVKDALPFWDGKLNGKDLSEGIYFYKCFYTDLYNNEKNFKHGNIQLVR